MRTCFCRIFLKFDTEFDQITAEFHFRDESTITQLKVNYVRQTSTESFHVFKEIINQMIFNLRNSYYSLDRSYVYELLAL